MCHIVLCIENNVMLVRVSSICLLLFTHYLYRGRGYGYVAVSRFKFRGGVHLYDRLRRTDFLPVGEDVQHKYL